MITEDTLLAVLEKEHLYAFKTDIDLELKDFILLKSESLEELVKFVKVNNINSIFYDYFYYSKDSYKFDLEEVELYIDESIFKLIKKDLISHNKKIDKIDFSRPKVAIIHTVYQGQKIGILILDSWIEELEDEILETEYQLEYFMEKYEDVIYEITQKHEAKFDDLRKEFEEFLLKDDEFLCCTNQSLRRHYMKSVFDKVGADKYKPAFMMTNQIGSSIVNTSLLWIYIESAWRKYKHKI